MRTYRTQETSYIIGGFQLNVKIHSPIFIKKNQDFFVPGNKFIFFRVRSQILVKLWGQTSIKLWGQASMTTVIMYFKTVIVHFKRKRLNSISVREKLISGVDLSNNRRKNATLFSRKNYYSLPF